VFSTDISWIQISLFSCNY